MNKSLVFVLAATALWAAGCDRKTPIADSPGAPEMSKKSAGSDTYLGSAMKAEQAMAAKVDLVSLNNAVELFNAQEGRYPENLNELVEKKYLAKLPTPPQGMKIHFESKLGKVTMASE